MLSVKHKLSLFFCKIRQNETVKFLLFLEEKPKHRVKHSLGVLECVLTFYAVLFLGMIGGFLSVGAYGLVGFFVYYLLVAVGLLEICHVALDR